MPINSFDQYPMSWRPTLDRSQKPLYLHLAVLLESDIKNGVLRPGTKLPPQRELADFLDINVSTVTRAFKICANKGLLNSAIGSGTFVSYDVNTSTLILPETAEPLIELGSMMPETLPQQEASLLLQKMLTETDSGDFFQYSYKNEPRHKEAAAHLLKKVGLSVTAPAQIFFANGGQNALAAAFVGLFHPGDRIGVDPLLYPGVKGVAKLFGIQLIPLYGDGESLTAEHLVQAKKHDNIKGIYLMPDLHNPTNRTLSLEERKTIAKTAEELDILILEDGINSLLLEKPLPPIAHFAPQHTVYMLSLSKTVLPALRLAYLYAPAPLAEPLGNALYHLNLSQSALLLELASRLILSEQLDRLLSRRRKGIVRRNRLADEILAGYDLWGSPESLSRWLILPDGISGKEFEELARENGVSLYGSERFSVGKEAPAPAARLAVCAPATLEELKKGLDILKDLLDSL